MKVKRLIFLLALLFVLPLTARSEVFKNEKLHYVITYKWGLIHKDAGEATLSLTNSPGKYNFKLVARTKPWADKFYQVRDTLLGTVRKSDFKALSYAKIAHEKGRYARDDIQYIYNGKNVTGECRLFRRNKEGVESTKERTVHGTGPVYDMLSVFYWLRLIDYDELTRGKVVKATVFSGSKAETITIRCLGREVVELRNKKKASAYHIQFNFTQDGKKKSSDDIDTWISTDPAHIPLYLVGKLPVGQVRVYYIP